MQISRVGAGGRKIIASLQGRLLLVGPGFCRHPGETLAHSARLPRLPKSHLSTGGPPNLSPPGAASRLYLDLGLEVQPTLSKYVCSLGSRTFHLFFPAALYSLQNPLPLRNSFCFSRHRVHEFPSLNAIEVIVPPWHPALEAESPGSQMLQDAGPACGPLVFLLLSGGFEVQGSPCSAQLLIPLSPVSSSLASYSSVHQKIHKCRLSAQGTEPSW